MAALAVDEVFLRGLDAFDHVVEEMSASDWERQSPCAGWTALDVLGHVGAIAEAGAHILEGGQPGPPQPIDHPSSLIDGDPAGYWSTRSKAVRVALPAADLERQVDSPVGRQSIADGMAFPAIDLFVHAWDVAASAGNNLTIPDDVIEFAHERVDPLPADVLRQPSVFGTEVQAPTDASPTESFIAWTGRDPRANYR